MAIASNWFTWALFSAVFAALTAIFAKMLFTPQMSAIEMSCRKSSGAKAREGVVTHRG